MLEELTALRDIFILLLGALIGAFASITIWRLQLREEKRRERAKILVKTIQLATKSVTYARSIIYSKIEGLKAVADLPENPVDEIMAVALVYFPDVYPLTKKLHLLQQDLYAHDIGSPNSTNTMMGIGNQMAYVATEIARSLVKIAEKEKLAV